MVICWVWRFYIVFILMSPHVVGGGPSWKRPHLLQDRNVSSWDKRGSVGGTAGMLCSAASGRQALIALIAKRRCLGYNASSLKGDACQDGNKSNQISWHLWNHLNSYSPSYAIVISTGLHFVIFPALQTESCYTDSFIASGVYAACQEQAPCVCSSEASCEPEFHRVGLRERRWNIIRFLVKRHCRRREEAL